MTNIKCPKVASMKFKKKVFKASIIQCSLEKQNQLHTHTHTHTHLL